MLVQFLPQQLVNQSTVFFMLVWQVGTSDLDVESYTKAINIMFFQHRLIFCQVLIISPVSSVFSVNSSLDREVTEYMANHRFLLILASLQACQTRRANFIHIRSLIFEILIQHIQTSHYLLLNKLANGSRSQ